MVSEKNLDNLLHGQETGHVVSEKNVDTLLYGQGEQRSVRNKAKRSLSIMKYIGKRQAIVLVMP